jgi:hypothetical protein
MRKFAIAFVVAFVVLIAYSIIGTTLEARGWFAEEGAAIVKPISIGFSILLFLILVYTAIPLAIRFFINGQIKIGNGDRAPVAYLRAHEIGIRHAIWAFFTLGFAISIPFLIVDL